MTTPPKLTENERTLLRVLNKATGGNAVKIAVNAILSWYPPTQLAAGIHRTAASLVRKGLVRKAVVRGVRQPTMTLYGLTVAGRTEAIRLEQAAQDSATPPPSKEN